MINFLFGSFLVLVFASIVLVVAMNEQTDEVRADWGHGKKNV